MAEGAKKKTKAEAESKTSVKSYQRDINAEKQKMAAYSRKMATNVRTLQANVKSLQTSYKKFTKEMKEAAKTMRQDGIKRMNEKVGKFKGEIGDQIKENKEAISHMESNVKYFLSEINKKKKDFRAYARGPFNDYIKAFWGVA